MDGYSKYFRWLANVKEDSLDSWNRPSVSDEFDARRHLRFIFEVDIRVRARARMGGRKGRSVDISESGISAVLARLIPLGEVVELDFELPFGPVTICAAARQRTAFRYGFQFLQTEAMKVLSSIPVNDSPLNNLTS